MELRVAVQVCLKLLIDTEEFRVTIDYFELLDCKIAESISPDHMERTADLVPI